MGYYVNIRDCRVLIPRTSFHEACKHLLDIRFLEDEGRMSGSTNADGVRKKWFAWVDMDALGDSIRRGDLPGVFEAFGFQCYYDEVQNIIELSFDRKCGDERTLLGNLAKFFSDGDFIDWSGEEGEVWRYQFEGGQMKEMVGVFTWREIDSTEERGIL